MKNLGLLITCTAGLLTTAAWAQSSQHKALNLELPPSSLASARSSAPPAHATSASPASTASIAEQPGVYYGDTSGHIQTTDVADTPACDDSTYNQPQVHGSVGAGVVAGNHVDGSYQSGHVVISRAFGSCDHPSGGMSISIGVRQGQLDGHHRH